MFTFDNHPFSIFFVSITINFKIRCTPARISIWVKLSPVFNKKILSASYLSNPFGKGTSLMGYSSITYLKKFKEIGI